jgi:Rhodanese-like domain
MNSGLNFFSSFPKDDESPSEADQSVSLQTGKEDSDSLARFSTKQTGTSPFKIGGKLAKGLWSDSGSEKSRNFFDSIQYSAGSPFESSGSKECPQGITAPPPSEYSSAQKSAGSQSSVLDPPVLALDEQERSAEFPYITAAALSAVLQSHVDNKLNLVPAGPLSPMGDKASPMLEEPLSPLPFDDSERWRVKTQSFSSGSEALDSFQAEGFLSGDKSLPLSIYRGRGLGSPGLDLGAISPPNKSARMCEESLASTTDKSLTQKPLVDSRIVAAALERGIKHRLVIVDCRYFYEYEGGHIRGAINICSPLVADHLFKTRKDLMFDERFLDLLLATEGREVTLEDIEKLAACCSTERADLEAGIRPRAKTTGQSPAKRNSGAKVAGDDDFKLAVSKVVPVIILHCEFSSQRGPNIFRHIRSVDRGYNRYPELSFPQLFVLKGGFEVFVREFGFACSPHCAYRPMLCRDWKQVMRVQESKVAEEWKAIKKTKYY